MFASLVQMTVLKRFEGYSRNPVNLTLRDAFANERTEVAYSPNLFQLFEIPKFRNTIR
jgi:hypothetical protein